MSRKRKYAVWLIGTLLFSGVAFVFIPTVLIALIGRFWYVEKKRSEEWKKQNQIEKD